MCAHRIQRISVVSSRAATVTAEEVPFPAIVPCDRVWAPESGEAPLTLSCHGIIDGVNVLTDEDGRSFLSASHTVERRLIATVESANAESSSRRRRANTCANATTWSAAGMGRTYVERNRFRMWPALWAF